MVARAHFDGQGVDLEAALRRAEVTDHAVVRYLERVEGRNIPALRRSLLTEGVLHGMALGAHAVQLGRLKLVLRGHSVVTVVCEGMRR